SVEIVRPVRAEDRAGLHHVGQVIARGPGADQRAGAWTGRFVIQDALHERQADVNQPAAFLTPDWQGRAAQDVAVLAVAATGAKRVDGPAPGPHDRGAVRDPVVQ